jgi:N-acetylmuramoyl-L-alanine amidase
VPRPPGESWYPAGRAISPRWKSIVIHHSATSTGGAASFDKGHRSKGWDELGYHFVIGNGTDTPDGAIEVGPRWHKQKHGAHCKTPSNFYNEHGIGICLVGDFTKTQPTRSQMASLERLLRFLCYSCNLAPDRITTHGAVSGKTQCPGHRFSLAPIKRALSYPPMASSMPR